MKSSFNAGRTGRTARLTAAGLIMLGCIAMHHRGATAADQSVGAAIDRAVQADLIGRDLRFVADAAGGSASSTRNAHGVTTVQDAAGGCDGIKNGQWGFHTASGESDAWWQVDLGEEYVLDRVVIFNRADRGTASRTAKIRVLVATEAKPSNFQDVYEHNGQTFLGVKENKPLIVDLKQQQVSARIVRLLVPGRCSFALDEVEVYTAADVKRNVALRKPADQKSVGPYSFPGTLPEGADRAAPPQAQLAEAQAQFRLEHSRSVVDRAKKLAQRLHLDADEKQLDPLVSELDALDRRLSALEQSDAKEIAARRAIFIEATGLARRIAFCNQRLKIDKLLFLKRHDSAGVFHMCDQFYGCNAVPGGGLYVLSDPFGANPRLENLLEDSVVERGRLKGHKLDSGTFLSPELSFDGETILFAYSQAEAWSKYQGKEAYEWTPEYSYHIFRCNTDGSGLVQLTDGSWNDFDPCFLPNGRIAFISERRGGYLRCGRHCPVYTLHSMADDGSDIIRLSHHETHEWQPSVANDGTLVYTRWDYIDRDTNIAHHMWSCFPDGRDPRSFHGNYPSRRESRPWMEMSIRAIPGSHKFVAATGAHHGQAFGSLVMIDTRLADDNAMSQLTRLTPDVPFPEAEGGKANVRRHSAYGTPWPLSEDDYLCVYDAQAKNRGIYWIDRFGNKELIYRDPEISCLSPIPLQPRPKPPVIPDQTIQTAAAKAAAKDVPPATITITNVYDADFSWPEGTRIDALRIIQALPKTTAPPNQPRIGVANQTNARAVLGTVPVEEDGSVYFEAPTGKVLYFQTLDARGMAVQSMRSGTYLHPGEQMTCQGCHEPKRRTPTLSLRASLAVRRAPSRIRAEVDGANPFNYVRLVQSVLDRNCVECHKKNGALDLAGTIEGGNGWTRSYNNLAKKYGFYFDVSNGSINNGVHGGARSIAGKFGARASGLLKYLGTEHHGVELSDEDFHRLTLWLDCNSEFYGSYERTKDQAQGKVVLPVLD
ncbi:MAG TPA: discoidin domain-containing protein [Pirellulaceae bacterium]|nr:discoidin domain-containing protein [Pirellulaceae bacterium]